MKTWIDNKFVDIKDARVSVFDRGFLYGDGAFETMRGYAGSVFRLDGHMKRLFESLSVLRIKPPRSRKYLTSVIKRLLVINGLKSAYIRFAVTRGQGGFGIGYKDSFASNTVIIAKEFTGYPGWMHKTGISASAVKIRQNESSPLCAIKSMNYLNYIMARFYAKDGGYDEAIMTNTKGFVTEAATSNVFIVKDKVLITPSPDSGILPGITRGVVLEIARKLKIKTREAHVLPGALIRADEVFLTNTLAEVLPVTRIGPRRIGNEKPGEITKLLHLAYQKQVIRETLK